MPEEILVNDDVPASVPVPLTVPLFTYHRGTIDVIDLGRTTPASSPTQTDCDPRAMALVIAGGTGGCAATSSAADGRPRARDQAANATTGNGAN
jgi:hypothetical protein